LRAYCLRAGAVSLARPCICKDIVMLERSNVSYSGGFVLTIYLVVAVIVSGVVVLMSLLNNPTTEIVNGVPFVTDTPGLDRSAATDTSRWDGWFGLGFIGFVRLVPVPDCSESETKSPSAVYSLGREDQDGSALPASYSPIFSGVDLMRKLGITKYEIYRYRTLDDRGRHVSY